MVKGTCARWMGSDCGGHVQSRRRGQARKSTERAPIHQQASQPRIFPTFHQVRLPCRLPEQVAANAAEEVQKSEAAVQVFGGENNVHAKLFVEALKAARAKSRVPPVSERLTSCRNFLERARKRVTRADLIAKAVEQKAVFLQEVPEAEERLKQLEAEESKQTRPRLQLLEIRTLHWLDGVARTGHTPCTGTRNASRSRTTSSIPRCNSITQGFDRRVCFNSSACNCFNRSSASATSCKNTAFCSTALAMQIFCPCHSLPGSFEEIPARCQPLAHWRDSGLRPGCFQRLDEKLRVNIVFPTKHLHCRLRVLDLLCCVCSDLLWQTAWLSNLMETLVENVRLACLLVNGLFPCFFALGHSLRLWTWPPHNRQPIH